MKILSAVAAVAFLLPVCPGIRAADAVSLVETGAGYRITGKFETAASVTDVWNTLTDYDRLADILSDLRESSVVSRTDGSVVVRQELSARFLVVVRTVELLLGVTERPFREIEFRELSGRPFREYAGRWLLEPAAGRVRVTYELTVSKGSLAPVIIEKKLFLQRSRKTLLEMKNEMARRIALRGAKPR